VETVGQAIGDLSDLLVRALAAPGDFLLGLLADAGLPGPMQVPVFTAGVLLLALAALRVSFVGTLMVVPMAALLLWAAHALAPGL
jgi:hypothetical protein